MKSPKYMDRAMRSRDPRFARILTQLGYPVSGYARRDMQAAAPSASSAPDADTPDAPADDLAALRAEYHALTGRRPFNGWDADTLRRRIAAAQADTPDAA